MDFSPLFASDPNLFFLNAGTQSRVPTSVLHWMRQQRDRSELNPTRAMVESFPALWVAQTQVASFLYANPADLYFRSNITAAFNDFLFALPMEAGDEILVSDFEYGAIAELARWRTRGNGATFRRFSLPLQSEYDEEEIVTAVVEALRPETKVLIVSHIATATGAVLPVVRIASEMQARGVRILVDGAHSVGSLPLDFRALSAVDFYGGNFHKWFMGPAGTGFGWVNPRWRGKLEWKFGGWASFEFPAFYGNFGEGDVETARRLIPGTIDPIPFLALGEVLRFWDSHGPDKIRAQQAAWRALATTLAEELGWERTCPNAGALLGPLVSFRRPAQWGGEIAARLASKIYRECGVQLANTSVRNQMLVRLSPGVYATEGEVRGGLAALGKFRAE